MEPEFSTDRTLLDAVVEFFIEDEWHYQQLPDKPIFRLGFQGENGSWQCYAQIREEQQQFLFYSVLDMNVPEDKRDVMAEFIARANYGLNVGNFEMDYGDGEVRFKTSIDVEDDRLSLALAKNVVYANVVVMDKYFHGIMSVVYGDVDPESAIGKIEG